MGMRVEYEVRKLSAEYVTTERAYTFVDDDTVPPDRWGRKRQRMVVEDKQSTGGWLFIIRGKPGHSIRLTSLDQLKDFKLKESPRMIDTESGEEVGSDGIPLTVKEQLNAAKRFGNLSGPGGTDIDVSSPDLTGDEPIEVDEGRELDPRSEGAEAVDSTIAKLE
jgi:hypothetical protein